MRREVPGVEVRLAGEPVASSTTITPAGAHLVCLSSAVPGLPAQLHSAYAGAERAAVTAIARVLVARDRSRSEVLTRPGSELPVTHRRRRLLVDHVAALRDLLEAESATSAAVELADQALELVDATY